MREELEKALGQCKQLNSQLNKERRRYSDLESKLKEDSVLARIKYAEKSQKMFDLSQELSSLKLKNQELLAEKVLCANDCSYLGHEAELNVVGETERNDSEEEPSAADDAGGDFVDVDLACPVTSS